MQSYLSPNATPQARLLGHRLQEFVGRCGRRSFPTGQTNDGIHMHQEYSGQLRLTQQ